jgi:hypothetical protein
MFKDLRDMSKMGKEMGGERPSMKEGIAQAKEALQDVQETQAKQQKLMQSGVQGQATIKELRDTGKLVNHMPELEMDLEVTIAGKDPYLVAHKQVIAHASLGGMQPGATVPVRVDPDDPAMLMIG